MKQLIIFLEIVFASLIANAQAKEKLDTTCYLIIAREGSMRFPAWMVSKKDGTFVKWLKNEDNGKDIIRVEFIMPEGYKWKKMTK